MTKARVRTTFTTYRHSLVVLLLVSISGCCARWQHIPDDCTNAFYECDLGCLIYNLCTDGRPTSCTTLVDCGHCVDEPCVEEPCVEQSYAEQPCTEEILCESETLACQSGCAPLRNRAPIRNHLRLRERIHQRVDAGPPPVRYRPTLPPKFLAVPTRPIVTDVNLCAPAPDHCQVEVGFDPQLAFPGSD